jgi:peroxiredoxin Q/BCP
MNLVNFSRRSALFGALSSVFCTTAVLGQTRRTNRGPNPPKVGETAKNFLLRDVLGRRVQLEKLTHYGPVTLVFLRGYPKAQSATCRNQFHSFLKAAEQFAEKPSSVVFVYPGDRKDLVQHAVEFLGRFDLPNDFYIVLDRDFGLTNAYGLKWDAIRETTYPSTLIIDRKQIVRYVKTSTHRGGRSRPSDVLLQLDEVHVAAYDASATRRR